MNFHLPRISQALPQREAGIFAVVALAGVAATIALLVKMAAEPGRV